MYFSQDNNKECSLNILQKIILCAFFSVYIWRKDKGRIMLFLFIILQCNGAFKDILFCILLHFFICTKLFSFYNITTLIICVIYYFKFKF